MGRRRKTDDAEVRPGRPHLPSLLGGMTIERFLREHWQKNGGQRGEKLLMSFHGIPQQVVDDGDPYALVRRDHDSPALSSSRDP